MQLEGIVANIQHFTIHDGPGIRTEVFLKGCPFAMPLVQAIRRVLKRISGNRRVSVRAASALTNVDIAFLPVRCVIRASFLKGR